MALCCALLNVWAAAQAAEPANQGFTRPTASATRIQTSEAPIIDGDLSDGVWAKATVIDKLVQKQPNPGAEPTERTVVRILYDENNLYFSVYCYDKDPDQIVIRARARDGAQNQGDYIRLYLDPGTTRRDGYA